MTRILATVDAEPLLGATDRPGLVEIARRRMLTDEFDPHRPHSFVERDDPADNGIDAVCRFGETVRAQLERPAVSVRIRSE